MTNDTWILFRGLQANRPAAPTAIDQAWFSTDTGYGYVAKNTAGTLSWQALAASSGASLALFTQTASVTVANSTSELTLVGAGQGSVTLPAGYLTHVGRGIYIRASGVLSDTGVSPTLTLRFKYGTTVLCATAAIATAGTDSNVGWSVEAMLIVRSTGVSGTVFAQGRMFSGILTNPMATTAAVTIDTTAATALDLTAQWGTGVLGDTITCSNLDAQMIDPNGV